jgi:hypothetical protein
MQENLQAFIYKKNIKNTSRNPEKLLECHCIGKILKYPRISLKLRKCHWRRVWHMRGYCWRRGDFPARFLANRWSILVDLMSRILMVVVLTVVDG